MKNTAQKGYVTLAIMIFIGLMFFFYVYSKFENTGEIAKTCPVIGNAPTYSPQFTQNFPENRGNRQVTVPYVLVRENVILGGPELLFNAPDGEHATQIANNLRVEITKPGGTAKLYKLFFAETFGEFIGGNKAGGGISYNMKSEGYIYAMHLGADGVPVTLDFDPTKEDDGEPPYAQIADMYQMKEIYDDPSRTYDDNGKVWECPEGGKYISDTYPTAGNEFGEGISGVIIPTQSPSTSRDQVQLEWFKFGSGGGTFLNVSCKPAIYLYPKQKQLVNVKVKTKGVLTYVDPPYPDAGWTVTAFPSGKIDTDGKFYDYLYYESKLPESLITKPQKGWVVKYSDLNNLYSEILPKLGLNEIHIKDFSEYWEKALDKNVPYYFVGIASQDEIDFAEPLEITPNPDSVNRVRIFFERLDEFKEVTPPDLSTSTFNIQNSTFRVIEWGGFIKNDRDHPFICSQ